MFKWFKRRSKRAKVFYISAVAVSLCIVGTAAAAWVLSASNSKWVTKGGSLQTVTFTLDSYPANGSLVPGSSVALKADTNNPNPFAVTITGTTGTPTIDSGSLPPGCSPANYTVNAAAFVGVSIPAGVTDGLSIPGAISAPTNQPTACQGASIEVTIPTLTYGVGS